MQERITVMGRVAGEPQRNTKEGSGSDGPVTFRFATRDSRFDEATRAWVESETNWYTVKAWRTLGENVLESVAKGQPLIIRGRLQLDSWTDASGRERITPTIHADSIGHDLRRGVSTFTVRSAAAESTSNPPHEELRAGAQTEWTPSTELADAPF
jgi:single-strand DNA-binding protein